MERVSENLLHSTTTNRSSHAHIAKKKSAFKLKSTKRASLFTWTFVHRK